MMDDQEQIVFLGSHGVVDQRHDHLRGNKYNVERQYSVLLLSPPKGDLPPMGGILVKMPPKCPP